MAMQALRDNPKLASLYLGSADGDFFMVRPLRSDMLKQRFNAPDKAAYQVWAIDRGSAGTDSDYLFYDGSLNQLSRRQKLSEPYDPRQRDWFKRARGDGGQITTAPYLFFSTQEIGTTLARRSGLTTVIGADLTLDGVITGTGDVTKNGAATLTLNGSNLYSGETILTAGTLVLGNNNALGTGVLSVTGASTLASGNSAVVVKRRSCWTPRTLRSASQRSRSRRAGP